MIMLTYLAIHTIVVPLQTALPHLTYTKEKNRKIFTKRKETKGKDKNTVIKEMEENGKCEIQTIKERKGSLQSVSQYFDTFGCFNKFFFHCK